MTDAWKTALPTTKKIVLLALCDNANDQGECYPSISTIAEKCSLTERAVFSAINFLEKEGIIRKENRNGRSTIYHINPCISFTPERRSPLNNIHHTPEQYSPPPLNVVHPTPERRSPITINEPSIESSCNHAQPKNKLVKKPYGVSDQLWSDLKSAWKAKRKPVTETAISKIAKVSHETGASIADVIFMIVDGNWQGVESEWVRNKLKSSPRAQQSSPAEGQKRIHNGEQQTYYKLVGWVCEGGMAA